MKYCLSIVLILSFSNLKCQDFEGVIIYHQTYKSKNDQVSDSVLTTYMGDRHEYYISTDNYKSITNGSSMTTLLYDESLNIIHFTSGGNSTKVDASISEDSLINYTINRDVGEVLGYGCNELVLNTKNSTLRYYYCPEIKFDNDLYENHKYGFWNIIISVTKSIPLKYIMDFKEFRVVGEAIKVKEMSLDSEIFKVR